MGKLEAEKKALPPYISLATLKSLVAKLKETAVPPRIDGSMLKNYAGSTAAQLVAALKFLKLVDDSANTEQLLTKLVNAYETASWSEVMKTVMEPAFKPIVGDLKLDTATFGMLREKFAEWGAEGEVLDKCVRFFESAMTESGIQLSPHILNRPRAKPDRTKTKVKKGREEQDDGSEDETVPPPNGTVRFSVPIPGKGPVTIVLPEDFEDADRIMLDAMITAYVTRKKMKAT
jgi:hypothetical protein